MFLKVNCVKNSITVFNILEGTYSAEFSSAQKENNITTWCYQLMDGRGAASSDHQPYGVAHKVKRKYHLHFKKLSDITKFICNIKRDIFLQMIIVKASFHFFFFYELNFGMRTRRSIRIL